MALAIQETEVGGERFMRMCETLLVASKSVPGTWHRIDGATCTCPSFQFRRACRHVVAAALMEPEPAPVLVTVARTEHYGGGWIVWWGPAQHGGIHYQESSALDHAQELREAPAGDYAQWLEMHGYGSPTSPVPPGRPALHLMDGGAR